MKKFRSILALILIISLSGGVALGASPDGQLELEKKNERLHLENVKLKREVYRLNKIISKGSAKEVPVLMYHHIYDGDLKGSPWEDSIYTVSLDSFKSQMNYLKEQGYYTASPEELELFIDGKLLLPKKTVVLTFDDGYRSNLDLAYPILKENNFLATVFIVGNYYENAAEDGLFFGEEAMKGKSDHIKLGSHSYNSHKMDKNNRAYLVGKDQKFVREDLRKMKDKHGFKVLAYPFGKYDQDLIKSMKDLGYTMGITTDFGKVKPGSDKYRIPRKNVQDFHKGKAFEKLVK